MTGSEVGGARVLPRGLGVPLAVVAACAAVGVAVLAVAFAGQRSGTGFDVALRSALVGQGAPWRQLALAVDYTAEPVGAVGVLAVLVVVFARLGQPRAAVLVVAGTAGSVAMTTALKPLVGRDINDGFLAFPSGHTAAATAATLVVMLVLVRRTRLAAAVATGVVLGGTLVAACVMAWAQVLLDAHYPTDAVGGCATALAVVPALAWTIDRLAGTG